MEKIWYKFLYQIFKNHIKDAFESGMLFKILVVFIPKILKDFLPFKHERLSYLLGKEIRLETAYLSVFQLQDSIDDYLLTLQV